jgi:23S rRNA (cytidine1920-2'-O)/16S rRNA (cytidine1409-2'-O)-methyltransferase
VLTGRLLPRRSQVRPACFVDIRAEVPKYVCRAGLKLEKALEAFALDVKGSIVLDAGLSTGGFTDCLLQHGAAKARRQSPFPDAVP